MKRMTIGAAMLAASLALGACSKDSPTQPDAATLAAVAAEANDYSLVMFGASGAALEGTMGPQDGSRPPFDGRTGFPPFPDSLALSASQQASIDALHTAFQATHQADLDALKAIFEQARAAHDAGASRDSIRAILEQGKPIGQALQAAVDALHTALLAVLTDAQKAWLQLHRPPPPPDVDGRGRPDPFGHPLPGGPGGRGGRGQ
jgi:hypothetical protein